MKNRCLTGLLLLSICLISCKKISPEDFPERITINWDGKPLSQNSYTYYNLIMVTGAHIWLDHDGNLEISASFRYDSPWDIWLDYIKIKVPASLLMGSSSFPLEPDHVLLNCKWDPFYYIEIPDERSGGVRKLEVDLDYDGPEPIYVKYKSWENSTPSTFFMTIDELETVTEPDRGYLRLDRVSGSFRGTVKIEREVNPREVEFDGTYSFKYKEGYR